MKATTITLVLWLGLLSFSLAQNVSEGTELRLASGTKLSSTLHRFLAHQTSPSAFGRGRKGPIVDENERKQQFSETQFLIDQEHRLAVHFLTEDVKGLVAVLNGLGAKVVASSERFRRVEAFVKPSQLLTLDDMDIPSLKAISAIYKPITTTGSVTSQADIVMQTQRTRRAIPSLDGSGVQVGILSDSYDNLGGEAAGIASGDLPSAGVDVLQELSSGGSDEGRAMVELMYDLAPGADYYFATAFTTPLGFADNIRNLANIGCTVIVDDVVSLLEPMYQDGIVALAVDEVVTLQDVSYFSSAGNQADNAYENTAPTFAFSSALAADALDFSSGSGDFFQEITLNQNETIHLSFQWDDPFYRAGGVDTNLDLFLYDDTQTIQLASSTVDNVLNELPVEIIRYTNTSPTETTFNLAITLAAGPPPGRMKYINFGTHTPNEYDTNSPSIFGHSPAAGAIAVAAVPYFLKVPEPFTSMGPTTTLFDDTGTRLATEEVRNKPDLAGIDGTNTTFFGSDTDSDGFPNFFGTSAAAPHVAAVATLVRQRFPTFTSSDVRNALLTASDDIGDIGFDLLTGEGLVDAFEIFFDEGTPATLGLSEGMEGGFLSSAWELRSTAFGRILVTDENSPSSGTYHLTMDVWGNGVRSRNEAILHFDATNYSDIILSFDHVEFTDEDDVMSSTFVGSEDSDGVALSVDGTNWFRIADLTGLNISSSYQTFNIDLSQVATDNGLTMGTDVRIKFQQYDDFQIAADGFGFDNITITGSAILPVTLVSFQGQERNGDATLTWQTATEINNDFFEVQYSASGDRDSFVKIGKVDGHGDSDQLLNYSFVHRGLPSASNYYRLKQVDHDGSFEYSPTIFVDLYTEQIQLALYPNPSSDVVRLQVNGIAQLQEIKLHDIAGNEAFPKIRVGTGAHNEIDLSGLKEGVYILSFKLNGQNYSRRLIKM